MSTTTFRPVGGLSETRPVSPQVRELVRNILPELSTTNLPINLSNAKIIPVTYATQVVAGINYFVKVQILPANGSQNFTAHLRIFRNLQGQESLASVEFPKEMEDPITYF